jgi:presenilin-like A22 family membrane protease
MMNKILFFVLIFLFCTVVGLYVGYNYIPEVGDTNPVTGQSVDDLSGTWYFLTVILVGTIGLLLVLKYYRGNLLFRLLEVYIVFVGSMMVWQFVLLDIFNATPVMISQSLYLSIVFLISGLTVFARFVRPSFNVRNITLALAIAGAGGALGSFVGFIPALVLVLALGTYDVIAVFKTKHMVKLADKSRLRKMPVMFETSSKGIKTGTRKGSKPGEQDVLGLGTGDIAIPLIFFVAILRTFSSWVPVAGAVLGEMFGLGRPIYYVTQVKRIALPALPPIISFSIFGFAISLFLL